METMNAAEQATPSYMKRTVPVGMTPVPKYATWDEHRAAMRRDAAAARLAGRKK